MCVVVKRAMPHSTFRPLKGTFLGSGPVWHGVGGLVSDCRVGMFMARGSTREEGKALVVLLVLAAIAVPLILSGIDVARGLSVGGGQGRGISNNQYAAMTADAMVAQTTDLVDGAAPKPSATLTWTDGDEGFHYAHYTVVDGEVLREHDGSTTTVARSVVAARFSRVGKTLIFAIDLESADGAQTTRIEVFARSLQ